MVTTGAAETGVKVVATVTGVVLVAGFDVVPDSAVTTVLVVATVDSGIGIISNTLVDKISQLIAQIFHNFIYFRKTF